MNVPERDESAAAEQGLDQGWKPKELTQVSAALALSESATADDRVNAANVLIQSRLPGQPFDPTGSTYFSGKNPDPVAFYDYARKVFEIGPESILTPEYKELMAAQDDEEKVLGIAKSKLGPFRRVVEKIGDLTEDPFAPLTDSELQLADDETKAANQILADHRRYRNEAQAAYSSRRMPTDVEQPSVEAGSPEFKAAAEKVAKHRQNVKDRGTIADYQSKVLADNVWYQYQLVKDKLAPDTDEIVRMAFSSKTLTPRMADKFRNLKDGDQQRLAASLIYGAKLRGDKALLRDAGREFAATLIDVPKDAFESLFVDSVKRLVMDDAQYQKQAETAALLAEAEAPRMAEYGYWGDAVIGFAATIPYMGYAMIPKIGTGMIAAKAAKDFEERVAASGGDVTSGEFQAAKWSSAIAYAALEKMQALRIGGPITDLQKRQAFLHFWRKANAGIVARTVVGNTAAETWQEGVQKAVEDGFVAYGLGQDVARNAAMGLVQELKDASGTMFLTSLSGVGVQAVRSRATRNHTLSEIISGSLHASALIDAHRNNDAEAIAKHRAALASLSRQVRDAGSTQNAIDQLVKQGVDEVDATVLTTFLENEARMIRKDAGLTEDQKEELIGKERTAVEVMQDLMPDARVEANAGADGTPDGTFTIRRTVAGTETVTRVVPVENVQFDLSTPESAASALKRLNEYGANLTTEAWNGMTEDEKRQILAQKGISKASAWRFESPSGQGVTDGQLKVLTGEIQIARGMEPSTIFHEYFHGMVKYLTETKALAPADVAKLREEFGPPAEGVDEQFNEEDAADRFKDYAAKKVHFTQSSALEKVWEAAADLLSKAKELVFRTKQAQPTIDEAMFEQVISGEYTGIPVATVRKSKEKAQETPAPDATPAQDEPEAGTKPDTAPAEIPPANANVGPNPAKPPASHGGMNLDGLKAKDQQKVADKAASFDQEPGKWQAVTPKEGVKVSGSWAVTDLDALVTSDSPDFDRDLQPRDRGNIASRVQIHDIARRVNPLQLYDSAETDGGSPIVTAQMHVLSGNGRTLALRKARDLGLLGDYEIFVRKKAAEMGIDIPASIRTPVLVRRVENTSDKAELQRIAELSNIPKILARNESEMAEADAKMLVDKGLLKLFQPGTAGNIMALSNAPFMVAFVRAAGADDLVNSDGHPTDLAERRVKRALLALLIGEGENARQIIRSLTENAQEMGMGTVVDGVLKSIGDIVGISQAKPSMSIVDATGMALRDYLEMKIAGFTNAQNWVNQGDLFNTRPQAVASLVQAFAARANTSIGIAAIFRDYAAKARIVDVSTGSLGLANVDTMESLLDKAIADTASEAEADAKAQASPTPADADKATVPPPPPVAKRQEEAKADKQEDEERQPPPRTSLAIQPGQTPFAEIGKGQKAVPTKDAPETKWKLGIPLFMGAKRGLADRATAAIRRLLSKRQREAVKTVWDGFGGSGGWGLYHALENFTNADTISIGEYDLNRMEKIKFFHAKGDKLGEVINSPAFVSIRRDIVRAMVSRQDASAAQPTLNLGVEQAQPVKQELTSAGTLANRAQEILDARIKAGELNSADVIAAVQAIIDTANNGRQQGADSASEMFDEIERTAIRDAAEIFKSAQAFRARGGKIEYRPERDTYETAIPAGNSVFVLLDPPYYLTQDYDPNNPGKKVGIDTYRRTRDIVRRAVSQGNGILYTDSAWWIDNKANAEAGLTVPEDHQIVVDIYNELDHFDVVDGKVGDRHEAIGVHHGRQGTETERRSRDGVAGPAVQQEADGRIHQPGGTGTPADQDLPGMAEGTPGQAGPVRSEDDSGPNAPRLTFEKVPTSLKEWKSLWDNKASLSEADHRALKNAWEEQIDDVTVWYLDNADIPERQKRRRMSPAYKWGKGIISHKGRIKFAPSHESETIGPWDHEILYGESERDFGLIETRFTLWDGKVIWTDTPTREQRDSISSYFGKHGLSPDQMNIFQLARGFDNAPRYSFDRTGPLNRDLAAAVLKSRQNIGAMEEDELKAAIERNDPLLPYHVLHYWNTIGFTEIADNANPEITQAFEDALARIPPTSLPGMTLYRYQGYQTAQARAAYLKGIKPGAYIEIQRPTNAFSRHMSYGQEMADAFGGRFVVQFVVESPRQGRDLGVIDGSQPGGEYLYRRGDRFRVASVENGKHGEKVVKLEESSRAGTKQAARFSFEWQEPHLGIIDSYGAVQLEKQLPKRLENGSVMGPSHLVLFGDKARTADRFGINPFGKVMWVGDVPDKDIQYAVESAAERIGLKISGHESLIAPRFNSWDQPSRFSFDKPVAQIDADYMAAVERGDMATAQRIVDEAVKKKIDDAVQAAKRAMAEQSEEQNSIQVEWDYEDRPEENQKLWFPDPDIPRHLEAFDEFVPKDAINEINGKYVLGESQTRYDSLEDAQSAYKSKLQEWAKDIDKSGSFGQSMSGHSVSSKIFDAFPEHPAIEEDWGDTKWGSWYLRFRDQDGAIRKISVRDHDASRKDMGIPDKTFYVEKSWTPDDVGAALIRAWKYIQDNSSDPIVRNDAGRIIPPSELFNPQSDNIRYSFARMRPEVSGNSAAIASLAVQKLAGKEIGTEQAARAMYLFKPEGATADQLLAEANKMADGAIGQAAKRALESADPTKAMTIIAANAEMQAAVAARAGAVEGAATALRMGKTAARGEAAAMKQLLIAAKGENLQQFEMDTGISWTETLLSFLPEKWKQWEDDAKKGDQVQGPQKPVDAPEPPKATEQELAEREKRMGQLIEAAQAWDAQRRAKLEKERDDKKAEDAKEGAGGETEQTDEAEEAAIPAIPRELLEAHGVDLTSPEAIAHAIRLWIGDWIVRNSDGRLTPETVWKDPEAVEMYRKTIRQQLEDMAAKLLDPSDSGPVFVARMIGDLPRTGRPDTFERRTALILASIQAHAIRQSRRELVKGIRKTIDDMAKQGKKFDPMEEDLKRKVSAEPEKIALYIKQYIGWGADKCHAELEKLQAQIEARQKIYDEQHGSLDATADVQLNYDQIKLAMLARWGNLKSMLPAEIKAAGEEITAWLSSEQERLQRDWFRQAEANSGMMTDILEGVVPTDPEKAKQEPGAVQQFVEAHTYTVRQRLEALLRHGNPAKRAAAMKAIEEVMFQMSRGTEVYEATRLKYRKQWDDAVIDATRGMDGKANRKAAAEWVKHLDEPIPAEISNAVSRQGYRGTMTYGQAIQLYVGLTQRFYADNVLRNKRGDHAAKIRSILTPADLKMVARMRDIYEQRRAELSAVVRKVTGLDVWRPDPLYMPVQMYLGSRGGLGTAGSVRAWKSLSDALTPRVRNNRDFDESVDIQSMFYQRMEDTARAIGYGARGLTIRGVLGKKDLHDVVERYYGKQTVAELMKHVTQVMAGVQRHGEGSVESTLAMIRKANTYMALSYNLLSMAKQIGSVPAFMFKLGTGEFVTAIGQYDSASWAELKDSDGFKARYMGGIAPEVMEILDDPGQSKLKRAYKAGMVTVQAGDYLAAKIVATGIYKAKVAQLSNKGMPIELAKERAKTETWSIVEETQQSGRTENVSGVYRNYGEMAKLIFQFASAPLMQLSHEYHAAMDAKAGVPGAKERLVRAVLLNHVIIPGIMSTIAWAFNSLLLGDEPPEDRDTILEVVAQNLMFEPLSRILIVGSVMEALGNSILKGKLPGFSNDVPASRLARTVGYAGRSVHDLFTMDVEQFQADILELAKQASAPVRHVSTLIENRIAE